MQLAVCNEQPKSGGERGSMQLAICNEQPTGDPYLTNENTQNERKFQKLSFAKR